MTDEALAHRILTAPWREKSTWAATRGRNVERIADGIRRGLLDFTLDGLGHADLLAGINGLRDQLDLIERQVNAIHKARQSADDPAR